ncbi:hypothetical protein GIW05_00105 [Pseudomonas syringae]|uniref:hypothetical protein n=1 Tax=Pseudomonas syringae TaxID=317 RepID=UPI001F323F08|nr:hypothetical protein [Pseudomonas syringae]MCF5381924.1 hypothetical protein [Pseudomonas syringae]MCF5423822.1 hypothetical protein [Pseudomonas syringae]MCF5455013.1 hypothetical protein [Pseudomonas syringae]MCF5459237.1 hypothetical protein [Pseudomonas syringae]
MKPTSTLNTSRPHGPAMRWTSRSDLARWIAAFKIYFPKKAHLAEKIAARLSEISDIAILRGMLPAVAVRDEELKKADRLYAQRRLYRFKEDRFVLAMEFRILPDAADLFLKLCPVGCGAAFVESVISPIFDPALCYYPDDQTPSTALAGTLEQQYQQALGETFAGAGMTNRIGDYLPVRLIGPLFEFLGLEFKPDPIGDDGIQKNVLATRIGWVNDSDLGAVECFAMPVTVHPQWRRDELFWSVLKELNQTRDLETRPTVVLNNKPHQLIKGDRVFTSIGFLVMHAKVVPFFVTSARLSFADTVIEAVTFNADTTDLFLDHGHAALAAFWGLLQQNTQPTLADSPAFHSLPDNWMVMA